MTKRPTSRASGPKRRDFLAGVGAAALAAGFPWAPRTAVAQGTREAAPAGAEVASIGIYPAIGICRVGGSDMFFYAPELPGRAPDPGPGGFKDGRRKIKKQAQRFRVYGYDSEGRVIGELNETNGHTVEWSVHLVNAKAAWYGFNNPLDNGFLAPGLPGQRRNPYFVTDQEREEYLVIDGGERSIHGANVNAEGKEDRYRFEGTFWDSHEPVGLGRLQTDEAGRLVVIPPDGVSKSPTNAPITSFADNNGWHDDWCDGPVQAAVTVNGKTLTAAPAWVACIGPNFAPEIPPISTLHDVISDMNVNEGWSEPVTRPLSFVKHIYPTFRRLGLMDWVSAEANLRQGWLDVGNFNDPAYIDQIRDPSPGNKAFREELFAKFRDPYNDEPDAYLTERLKMPFMLGDGVNFDGSPLQWFRFPKQQYEFLRSWAEGDFIDDFDSAPAQATAVEDLPVSEQPGALTEAALEPCSGGAFHPGVELTYYLRIPTMYARNYDDGAEPFRLAHQKRDMIVQNIGFLLTLETATQGAPDLGTTPPLGKQGAGDLTRWMGLPWQCDAFSCQQVLMQEDFPTAVWWPALLPIDVLPEHNYQMMMQSDLPAAERVKFFENRADWKRGVAGIGYHANASYWDGITNMITLWERMGFVVKRPGPSDPDAPATIPDEVYVEVGRDDVEFRFNWKPSMGDLPE